jgi:hypothetical protein
MRRGFQPPPLTQPLATRLPSERLPITAGRIHGLRKVEPQETLPLFNASWLGGKRWLGEYLRAPINTGQQRVSFWHQPEAPAAWRCLKPRQFRLQETVPEVVPEFRHHSTRCPEYFPS